MRTMRMTQRSGVFGVAAEGSRGLLWVAITVCDESSVESECREEEAASVDDNGRGE